jgi:hypothetical protein
MEFKRQRDFKFKFNHLSQHNHYAYIYNKQRTQLGKGTGLASQLTPDPNIITGLCCLLHTEHNDFPHDFVTKVLQVHIEIIVIRVG